MKKVFEQGIHAKTVDVEDGGQAKIVEVGDEGGMFVRIHSWSDDKRHDEFDKLIGKRVRVTIEVIGDLE